MAGTISGQLVAEGNSIHSNDDNPNNSDSSESESNFIVAEVLSISFGIEVKDA